MCFFELFYVFLCFFMFLYVFCFFFVFVFLFVRFSPSLFKLLHLQSKQHIKTEQLKEKHRQTYNKQKSPSRNLRDIYSRSVRGLDILYLCFSCFLYFLLFFEFLCIIYVLYVFLFVNSFVQCFRLVFLSFCIYNRKTHITTEHIQNTSKNNINNNWTNRNIPAGT